MFLVSFCSCLCPVHWSQGVKFRMKMSLEQLQLHLSDQQSCCLLYVLLILEVWWYILIAKMTFAANGERGQAVSFMLTHWYWVSIHASATEAIFGSDSGLSPFRRYYLNPYWQIRTLGINFSATLSDIQTFSFKKMRLKMSSAKWRPFCLGLNVLTVYPQCSILRLRRLL